MANSKQQFRFDQNEKRTILNEDKFYLLYRELAYEVRLNDIRLVFLFKNRCIFCNQVLARTSKKQLLMHLANPANHNKELTISASTRGLQEATLKELEQLIHELKHNLDEEQLDIKQFVCTTIDSQVSTRLPTTSYKPQSVAISDNMKTQQHARVCTALLEALGRGDQEMYKRIVQLPPNLLIIKKPLI